MHFTRTHTIGLAAIALLATAAAGLGTTLALRTSAQPSAARNVAERPATVDSTTTTTAPLVVIDAVEVEPANAGPAPKPAPAPVPVPAPIPVADPAPNGPGLQGVTINPSLIGKLQLPDTTAPVINVTTTLCAGSYTRVFFTITDASDISGLTALFSSWNGAPNPPIHPTIAGVSPGKYQLEYSALPHTSNKLTITATDAANNQNTFTLNGVCI